MAYRPDAGDQQPPASKRRRSSTPSTPTTTPIPQYTTGAFHEQGSVRPCEQTVFPSQSPSFLTSPSGVNLSPGSGDHGVFVGNRPRLIATNQRLANASSQQTSHHHQPGNPNFLMRHSGPTDRLTSQCPVPQPPFVNGGFPSSTVDSHQFSPVAGNSWSLESPAPADGISFDPRHYQPTQVTPLPSWPSPIEQLSRGPGQSQPPPPSDHVGPRGISLEDSPTSSYSETCYPRTDPSSPQPSLSGPFNVSRASCLPSPPESNPSHHRDMQSPFSSYDEPQDKRCPQRGGPSGTEAVVSIEHEPDLYGLEISPRATPSRGEPSQRATSSTIGSVLPHPSQCQYVVSDEEDDHSARLGSMDIDGVGSLDEILSTSLSESGSSKGKQKETTSQRSKACVRCRFQKQRCLLDPSDPDGPCIPCRSISRTSKKTLHRTPCFRNKITDTVLFRSGGLGLTQRWTGTAMKNVVTRLQARNPRTIEFTQAGGQPPVVINVVPFQPVEGDVTSRFWTVIENGIVIQKSKELKPFCLANIGDTAAYFEQYIIENAIPEFMRRAAPGLLSLEFGEPVDPIRMTYILAVHHFINLEDEVENEGSSLVSNREKRLLGNLFVLWFATRQTTGSAYICSEDTLDMEPETADPSYPLSGKVSLPRMLLAQFDSINHTKLLVPYRVKVLRELEYLILQNKSRYWFTIYVCLFILLREASWITQDRSRHANAVHQGKIRYSIPGFVENLQEGCNTLLMHWHYYNCRPMPDPNNPDSKARSFLADLTPEQYDLIMRTMKDEHVKEQISIWETYRKENGFLPEPVRPEWEFEETMYTGTQRRIQWDHPYYWIAQLYEQDWTPHPTYQREYIR